MESAFVTACVLGGCHTNLLSLEYIVRSERGKSIGFFLTFIQFIAVSLMALPGTNLRHIAESGKKRELHWSTVLSVFVFFAVSVINNVAFNFNISVPLHTVLRVGSLVSTLAMGRFILKRVYSTRQIASVLLVVVGIGLALGAQDEAKVSSKTDDDSSSKSEKEEAFVVWMSGVVLLIAGVILSSLLGTIQEIAYKKNTFLTSTDMMFLSHGCSLPMFLLRWSELVSAVEMLKLEPELWGYLVLNVVSQCVCIRSVFQLTKLTSALNLHVVITVRKFVSLVFSVVYFNNPFTLVHWCGSLLAFAGVGMYSWPGGSKQKEGSKKDD
eukprot:PhM_4_TR1861/c0_g1_i2/m.6954/K15278/SLC35B4, YEA4; solute carrier family 35 (UDP-xylose/UDP-N-acetylglucosamine transporter), member B4